MSVTLNAVLTTHIFRDNGAHNVRQQSVVKQAIGSSISEVKPKQEEYTHFMGLSLSRLPKYAEFLIKIRETVVPDEASYAAMPAQKLHITLQMLSVDGSELAAIKQKLVGLQQRLKTDCLDNKALVVKVKGLEVMRGTAERAQVLVANVTMG